MRSTRCGHAGGAGNLIDGLAARVASATRVSAGGRRTVSAGGRQMGSARCGHAAGAGNLVVGLGCARGERDLRERGGTADG
jgi:hypothetical protein